MANKTLSFLRFLIVASLTIAAIGLTAGSASAAVRTWTGGTSSVMDVTSNWNPAGVFAASDTAEWNGTQVGALSLTITANTTMTPGAPGVYWYVNSAQTSSLSVDASGTAAGMRLAGITIDPGAGAFTLGGLSLSNSLTCTIGPANANTAVADVLYTNNSSNTATIGADVHFNASNNSQKTFQFAGTGNWLVNSNLTAINGALMSVWQSGSGTTTIGGKATETGATLVTGGALNVTGTMDTSGGTLTNVISNSTGSGTANVTGLMKQYALFLGSGGGSGILNLNAAGTLSTTSTSVGLLAGTNGGTGAVNFSGGTINVTNGSAWFGDNSTASSGTLNMSGGIMNVGQQLWFGHPNSAAVGGTGIMNLTGGTINANFVGMSNSTASSCLGVGSGTIGANAILNSNTYVVVAFGGNGSGGATSNLTVNGTLNVSTTGAGNDLIMGQYDTANGTMTINSGATVRLENNSHIGFAWSGNAGTQLLSQNGGAVTFYSNSGTTVGGTGFVNMNSGNGGGTYTYALNGGTLQTPAIGATNANGTRNFNFNGGTLKATGSSSAFVNNLSNAFIQSGGAIIDDSGFNLTIPQSLLTDPVSLGGGLTKFGSGTMTLLGNSTYTGNTTVNAGGLIVDGYTSGGGNYAFVTGTTLGGSGTITAGTVTLNSGVNIAPGNNATTGNVGTLYLPNLSMGGGGTGYFDLSGSNTNGGDLVSVAGSLSLAGTTSINVNIVDNGGVIQTSGTSVYPLFSYSTLSGYTAGSFKLSTTGVLNSRQVAQIVNNPSSNQIDLDVIGVAGNLTWVGNTGASWDNSGGTTNWYNSNSNALDKFVPGDNVTFAAAGAVPGASGSGVVSINAAVLPGSVTASGGSYTLSGTGKITGATSLTVNSGATLVIANTNDYTGGTILQGGLITMGTNNGLPISGTVTAYSGTLDLAGYSQKIAGLGGFGGVITASSGNSTLTYSGGTAASSQFFGTITDTALGGGTLGVTVSAGTLDVTGGATNYVGATTVNGSGVLLANSLPNTGSYSVGSSATLSISNANSSYGATYSNSGNVLFGNSSGTINMNGPSGGGITSTAGAVLNVSFGSQGFGGSALLFKSGTGTLVMTGNSTYTGGTVLDKGTIQAGSGSSQPSAPGVGDFVWDNAANSAALDLNGQNISIGAISQPNASTTNVITNSASGTTSTLSVGSNGDTTTFAGVLQNGAGTLGLNMAGAGMFTLAGSNTYTGGTTISGGGTLAIAHSYSLPSGALSFAAVGGTLSAPFAVTLTGITFSGSQTMYAAVAAPSLTLNGSAFLLGSSVSGAGTQTFDLSQVSTFVYSASTQSFQVGGIVNAAPAASAVMNLAATNTITAATLGVGAFTNENFSAQNTGTLNLGQMNTINASSITVGYNKNVGTVQFQSGATNPTLVIRDSTGAGRATLLIGTDSSGQQPTVGAVDLVTGVTGTSVLNALISSGTIGTSPGGALPATGTLLMGGGTLDANTLYVGQSFSSAANIGTLSDLGGGIMKIGTLVLGDQESTGLPTANVTLDGGGTLMATSILSGGGTGAVTRNFYWNDGTIANFNSSGSTTGLNVTIPTITLASTGTHTLWIDAGQTGTISAALTGGGGSVDLIKNGSGTAVLTVSNPYFGATNVVGGSLKLTGASDINSSSAININGGSFIQDSSVASFVPTVTLTSGTLGGTGTFSNATVAVASSPSNVIVAGDSGSGTLTVNTLNFSGAGQINLSFNATQLVTTTLSANGAANSVVIQNVGAYPLIAGEYPLVQYTGTIGGTGSSAFTLGGGLPPRTVAHLDFTNAGVIDYDVTGVDYPIWTGSASNVWSTATISNPKNWKLAVAGSATDFLTGDNVQFDDTAHSGIVQITTANVQPASVTFLNTALAYTVSGSFGIADYSASQSTAVNLNGGGLVVFANSNSYSGGTNINGGTLQLGSGTANGSIAGNVNDNSMLAFDPATSVTYNGIISGSGALNVVGGLTVLTASETYTGATTISGGTLRLSSGGALPGNVTNNGTLTFNQPTNTTVANVINGVGALKQSGTTALILTASNGYTGTTYVNAGTLAIGNGGSGEALASTAIVNNAALQFNHTDTLTIGAAISGTGSVTKNGAGTLTLTGSNNYTGATTINAGFFNLASPSALAGGGNITFQGGTLEYSVTGATAVSSPVANSGASVMNFDITSGTLQMSGNLASSNTGGMLVYGAGVLLLSNSNNYSGTTTIGLNQGPGTVLATASGVFGTGTLAFDGVGNASTALLQLTNNITLSNPISFAGRNSGTPAIENVSGNNTLSGGLSLQVGGTYFIQSDAGLLTISGGTAITSNAGGARNVNLQGNGNGLISGAVMNGNATSGLSLTKLGTGAWAISNTTNSYTGGTNVNAGVLEFTKILAMPPTGTVNVAASATLAVNAGGPGEFTSATSGSGSIGGLLAGIGGQGSPVTWANSAILGIDATNASGGLTYSGNITNTASGSLGLTELGSGILTLTGSNTYSGGTTVTNGTLVLDGASSLLAGSSLVIGNLTGASATQLGHGSPAVFAPTSVAPVPEPGTFVMLAIAALAGLGIWRRRQIGG